MAWLILLASVGLVSLGWCLLGWVLPDAPLVVVFRCPQNHHPDGAISRYQWLRSLGLIRGKLVIIGQIPAPEQEIWKKKHPNVEFSTAEELPAALELERTT